MTKICAVFFFFLASVITLNALEISALELEKDGEITLTFCQTIQIENIALNKNSVAPSVILPKDEEIYENLTLLNAGISQKILACFEGVCKLDKSCKKPKYTLLNAKKIKDNLLLAKVGFDSDISTIFLVSSYQKKNKIRYRVKTPQDFKFLNKKYQSAFRTWLLGEIKSLL